MGKWKKSEDETLNNKAGLRKNRPNTFRLEKYTEMTPARLTYKIVDGIRYLDPYWSMYGSYTKGRWVGREVSEAFTSEFLSHNRYYVSAAIRMGRLFVNGKQMVDPNYRLQANDRLIHLGHRHEHPILAEPGIEVLVDNDKWFVINKPPSIPVHTCGQYRFHSVIGMLSQLHKITGLKICHRLDRTTSGLLILAKDSETDQQFKRLQDKRQLFKEYICKVEGIFPDGEIECNEPIGTLSLSMGIQCVRPDGKESRSKFKVISTNIEENSSIVSCWIDTGRTHQIRVHLQYLGYPIIDDSMYNSTVWGPEKGRGANYGKSMDELRLAVQDRHKASVWFEKENPEYEERLKHIASNPSQVPEHIDLDNLCVDDLPNYDPICLGCNVAKRVPPRVHFGLKLHCRRYKSEHWEFTAPLPDWAKDAEESKHEHTGEERKHLSFF
ncbi:RNA pseudouridylate synthase domain-containing protein [Ditylenchus destructor]|uniref:Pseudouridine synthase n=1 Tax=Ditylenchus destructor TaxID=166010 RepID=A0AAD4NHX8_9BILA|nr:RNA pseudouridylate synthase domain-containing protein [Ditylenchus destructor]